MALTAVVLAARPSGRRSPGCGTRFVRAFLGQFADGEWRIYVDRAPAYRRADGNVSDKERQRPTKLRL